jgi:hypothetical protein
VGWGSFLNGSMSWLKPGSSERHRVELGADSTRVVLAILLKSAPRCVVLFGGALISRVGKCLGKWQEGTNQEQAWRPAEVSKQVRHAPTGWVGPSPLLRPF